MKKKYIALFTATVLIFSTAATIIPKTNQGMPYKTITNYETGEEILLHGAYGDTISVPDQDVMQKRQFRNVWVSTVFNIDFKQTKGSESGFKKEFTRVVDELAKLNINAVTFQVRPCNDAFYPSKLNPWSQFLTGAQGKAPEGGFDPLKYMVDETHKRNMEFHAWFNPFRITTSVSKLTTPNILKTLSVNNFAVKNPQCVINFNGKLLLNPGEPGVQSFVTDSVLEVVKNYDIDAIHFDDYFYPYDSTFGNKNEDLTTFKKYGTTFKNIADWRRNNTEGLIRKVATAIKKQKKYVKFGISPFGIWRNKLKDANGSNVAKGTLSSFDTIYADTRKWAKSGLIDYITPQIYWTFAKKEAPYGELTDWWANTIKGTNCSLYIGHAFYKIAEAASSENMYDWSNEEELLDQLRFNSKYDAIKGSSFFSLRDFIGNAYGLTEKLRTSFFSKPAIIPAMPWLDKTPPAKIKSLSIQKDNKVTLSWQDASNNDTYYYAVYRFKVGEKVDIQNPNSLIAKVRREGKATNLTYKDASADLKQIYTYVVTSLDRLHNETLGVTATK